MITQKHKITLILIGQILLLLVVFQFGLAWWLVLLAVLSALLPWFAYFSYQPQPKDAEPSAESTLPAEYKQVLSQIEQILKKIFSASLILWKSKTK